MKLILNQIRHNLEKVKLEIPYSYQQISQELENEQWNSHANYTEKAGNPHLCRSTLGSPTSIILKEILV